jgi:hypothetical protein
MVEGDSMDSLEDRLLTAIEAAQHIQSTGDGDALEDHVRMLAFEFSINTYDAARTLELRKLRNQALTAACHASARAEVGQNVAELERRGRERQQALADSVADLVAQRRAANAGHARGASAAVKHRPGPDPHHTIAAPPVRRQRSSGFER